MSFDLAVFGMDEAADALAVRAMFERCQSGSHVEGELDDRIVGFYEELRAVFPDRAPYGPDSPWMSTPLAVGIDHVFMHLSFSRCTQAIASIEDLAKKHRLVLWDPQSGDAYFPAE